MKTSLIIKSNARSFIAVRPFAPPSVSATLKPHCLSQTPTAGVCRSSSSTRMRRIITSLAASGRGVGAPVKKGTACHAISWQFFALRISALSHLRRKLPRCLPCTVYKFGSIASRDHTRDFKPNRIPRTTPLSRRDVQTRVFAASDITPFLSLAVTVLRHCNSRVKAAIDGAGAAAYASCCRYLETASVTETRNDGAAH